METFSKIHSKICPLDIPNVDTDQIIPKQFLKRVERTGFGQYLFFDWRFDKNGNDIPEFMLNKPEHKGSQILLTRDNFGCGSSREHAPWALLDFGFKCIIAPSFADIFYNNCFQNGILPVVLDISDIDSLFSRVNENPSEEYGVDLEEQKITDGSSGNYSFDIDKDKKEKLLNGIDDIEWTLQFKEAISSHEKEIPIY